MKRAEVGPGLRLYSDGALWVLMQMQAAAGRLQEVFAASHARPQVAVALGIVPAIEAALAGGGGDEVKAVDHEIVAALLYGNQ